MKAVELRELGADELGVKERDLVDQLFRMRIQKAMRPRRSKSSDAISRA